MAKYKEGSEVTDPNGTVWTRKGGYWVDAKGKKYSGKGVSGDVAPGEQKTAAAPSGSQAAPTNQGLNQSGPVGEAPPRVSDGLTLGSNDPMALYRKGIAVEGTPSSGSNIGTPREIAPAIVGDSPAMASAQIAPLSVVNAQQIGTPEQVALATELRNRQLGLAGTLEEQAAGRGPSLATLQLQQALERSLKNHMGVLAAQPGVSQALAARLFGYQAGVSQQDAAMEAVKARMAEQLAARQQLQGLYQGARTQDDTINQINAAAANQRQVEQAELATRVDLSNQLAGNTQAYNQAQLVQAANQYNADASFKKAAQQAELSQQAAISNQGAFNQANQAGAQIAGGISQSGIQAGATTAAAAAQAGAIVAAQNIQSQGDIVEATINNLSDEPVIPHANSSSGGQVTNTSPRPTQTPSTPSNPTTTGGSGTRNPFINSAFSDKKLKKDVKPGGKSADHMMDKLASAIFEYKNKEHGKGKQLGVMAQDLEKSQMGKQMVESSKEGKSINFAKGLGAILAAQASLHKRMKALEARA